MKHIFQGLKIQGKMQLSQNVITFQFFMLWRGRTNRGTWQKCTYQGVMITSVIYIGIEKTISRERMKLLPLGYLHSFRTEDFNNRNNVSPTE